jgi:ankyrin repeat protein
LIIELLVAAGADVNYSGSDGTTPIMQAVWFGATDEVECLMNHGADPRITDDKGQTAVSIARKRGHNDLCEGLLTKAIIADKLQPKERRFLDGFLNILGVRRKP